MKKKFIDLKLNDHLFYVDEGRSKVKHITLKELSTSGNFRINEEELGKTKICKYGYYHAAVWFFANESDALRYAKAQVYKEFTTLKNNAHKSIQKVIDFRKEHYEALNTKFVELHILRLEKAERQSL